MKIWMASMVAMSAYLTLIWCACRSGTVDPGIDCRVRHQMSADKSLRTRHTFPKQEQSETLNVIPLSVSFQVTVDGEAATPDFDIMARVYAYLDSDLPVSEARLNHANWHDGNRVRIRPNEHGVATVRVLASPLANRLEISLESALYEELEPSTEIPPSKGKETSPRPIDVALKLVRRGSIQVRVRLPEDGYHKIVLDRWDPQKEIWSPGWDDRWNVPQAIANAEGVATFWRLPAGMYRAVDKISSTVSAPIDFVNESLTTLAELDLSKCGWATGVLELPAGASMYAAEVRRIDAPTGRKHRSSFLEGSLGHRDRPVNRFNRKTGAFRCRVPTGRPATLTVRHTFLRPDEQNGSITVSGASTGHRLKLVRRAGVLIRLDKPLPLRSEYESDGKSTVLLKMKDGSQEHVLGYFNARRDAFEFSDFEPGIYTLVIDTQTTSPIILRDIELKEGVNTLGPVSWTQGSTFRLRCKVIGDKEKFTKGVYIGSLVAKSTTPGLFKRKGDFFVRGGEIVGLTRGRYRINLSCRREIRNSFNEVIDFDGETDVERTIEIR